MATLKITCDRGSGRRGGTYQLNNAQLSQAGNTVFTIMANQVLLPDGEPKKMESGGYFQESKTVQIEGIGGDVPPLTSRVGEIVNNGLYKIDAVIDGVTKYGLEDQDGNVIMDCIYDTDFGRPADGSYYLTKYRGLWGLLDKHGDWLIPPHFLELLTKDKLYYGARRQS